MKSHKFLSIFWILFICSSVIVPLIKLDGFNVGTMEDQDNNEPFRNLLVDETLENVDLDVNDLNNEVEELQSAENDENDDYSTYEGSKSKGVYTDTSDTTYDVNETFTGYDSSWTIDTSDILASTSKNQQTVTINNVTNYDKKSGSFEITTISAEPDWFMAEGSDDGEITTLAGSDGYEKLAQEIHITVPRVNLSSVYLKLGWNYPVFGTQPAGDLYIVGETGSLPNSTVFSEKIDLQTELNPSPGTTTTWYEFVFSSPITLTAGDYYLVIEDTTSQVTDPGHWTWRTKLNSGQVNYGNCQGYISGDTWYPAPRDFYLYFQTMRVDSNNDTYTYSTPSEVSLEYNGTSITTSSFPMLLNEDHNFTTDISVNITGNWECNYTAQSLITASSNFSVNSTNSQWNVTAQNNAINTDYSIKDHLLNVTGLPSHWNATGVYYNTSSVNCINYDYSNGSSFLLFNATSNITQSTWYFTFQSHNYIESMIINGSSTFPYTTNQTVVLDVHATFKAGASDGNKSFVVYDPNDVVNYSEAEIALATHFSWDIDNNLDQNMAINGTYTLETLWNSSDRAGFFSVEVDLEVTTDLTTIPATDYNEVLIAQTIDVVAQFNNLFNTTGLQGATLNYNTTWGETGILTEQAQRGNYTYTGIDTSLASPGQHNVTINASLSGYIYQEKVINISLVNDANIELSIGANTVNYTDNSIVYINYSDTNGDPITTDVTIKVNDTEVSKFYSGGFYEYTYDSDSVGFLGSIKLEIEASKNGYKTKNDSISLTVESNPTTVHGSGYRENEGQAAIANKSVKSLYYNDSFVLELQYEDLNHSTTVDTYLDNLTIQTTLNYTIEELGNHNWNLTFNINSTDDQVVNVTFSYFGYFPCLYMVNLTITDATTTTSGQASGTVEVYYQEYNDTITITYTDTVAVHGMDIINATVTISGICNFIFEGNTSGTYTFNFTNSLTSMINQSVTITFNKYGYIQKQVDIYFGILARPTELTEELHTLTSGVTNVVYYQENYTLSFNLTDIRLTNQLTDFTMPVPIGDTLSNSSTMFSDYYNFTFYFDVTAFMTYDINITFYKYGYINQSFIIHFDVRQRAVTVTEEDSKTFGAEYLVFYLNSTMKFNFTLTDTNATVINDFSVTQNTNITYYGGTAYDFYFPADTIGYFTVNITFERFGYNNSYWYFNVTVDPRHTDIVGESGAPANNTSPEINWLNTTTFTLRWQDLNDSSNDLDFQQNVTVTPSQSIYTENNYNFSFTAGSWTGIITVTITFARYGYKNQSWIINYQLLPRPIDIAMFGGYTNGSTIQESFDPTGDSFDVILTLKDGFNLTTILPITDFDTPTTANITYVAGTFTFNFFRDQEVMVYYVNITFTSERYFTTTWLVTINLVPRDTSLYLYDNVPANYTALTYGDFWNFSILWKDDNASVTTYINGSYYSLTELSYINDYYNFSFYALSTGAVTSIISFNRWGYINQTFTIYFTVTEDRAVNVLETSNQYNETIYAVYYNNNVDFSFTLTDTNGTQITDFTVKAKNITYGGTPYDFTFPAGTIGFFTVNITFTRTGYLSKFWYYNFTVNPRPTELTEHGGFTNDSQVDVYFFDTRTFYFNLTDVNSTSRISSFTPQVTTTLLYNSSGFYNYTFYFNDTIGVYQIMFTFERYGYQNWTFIARFNVDWRDVTFTEASSHDNNTVILVIYNNVLPIDLTLTDNYNATQITDFVVTAHNITYSGTPYDFTFPADIVGSFTINITVNRFGYYNYSWFYSITVDPRPTALTELGGFVNDSSPVDIYFYDTYHLYFNLSDTNTTSKLTMFTVPVPQFSPSSLAYNTSGSYNYTFYFNDTIGVYQITFTFERYGYPNWTFIARFNVDWRDVTFTEASSHDNNTVLLVIYNNVLPIDLTLTDNYDDTQITDFTVTAHNITYSGTPYDFTFPADTVGSFAINITFNRYGYYNYSWFYSITVDARPTTLTDLGGFTNDTQLQVSFTDTHSFSLRLTDDNTSFQITTFTPQVTTTLQYDSSGFYDYTFYFNDTIGVYQITVTFERYGYVNWTFIARFDVITVTTGLGFIDYTNSSTQDYVNYTDAMIFRVEWFDTNHSLSLEDSSPVVSSSGSDYVVYNGYFSDRHVFEFTASVLGTYEVFITFTKTDYQTTSYRVVFVVNEAHTNLFVDPSITTTTESTPIEIDRNETLNFWMVWNDTDHDLNLEDDLVELLVNQTVNGEMMFISYFNGNHTFNFTTDTSGLYNLTLVFKIDNYTQAMFTFWVEVGLTITYLTTSEGYAGATIVIPAMAGISVEFNDSYTFWIYWNSTVNGTPLIDSALDITDGSWANYLTIDATSNGYHNFTFKAVGFQTYSFTITFKIDNYKSASFTLTISVTKADTSLVDYSIEPATVYNEVYYTDNLYFWVVWEDIRGNVITGTFPVTTLPEYVNFTGEIDGNYTFIFDASVIADYSFTITFSDDKFETAVYSLSITVNPAESSFIDLTDPDNSIIDDLLYLYTREFNVTWYDARHNRLLNHTAVGSNILGNGRSYVTVISIENGKHSFLINCSIVGTFSIEITFILSNYTTSIYHLTFTVSPIPTHDPVFVDSLPNETITGNIVSTVCSWIDTTEDEPYPEGTITVSSGSSVLTADILVISPGRYALNISTSGLAKGLQEIQIHFELYGYVNQSISANITILGHAVNIEFTVPETLKQGDPFTVSAYIYYSDGGNGAIYLHFIDYHYVILNSLSSGSTISYFTGYYQQQQPVTGEAVSFEILLELENGTVMVFNETVLTGSNGVAVYEIPGTVTQNAVSVTSVSAMYAGSGFNDPISLDYSIPGGTLTLEQTFLAEDLINLLIRLSPVIAIGLFGLSVVFILLFRRRRKKNALKRVRAISTRRIIDICNLNTIFCRHNDGLTFYTERIYGESGDTDALAGMSTAITAFIDDVAGKLSAGKGIERMEKGKFAMLSYQGEKSTLTVISTAKLSKYLEEMLETSVKEIERVFAKDLDKFYTSDQIDANTVKMLVRKHIPIGLLDAFTLDMSKLPILEKEMKLSKEQKTVIKSIRHVKADVPSSIPIYFLGSMQRQLKADYDSDLTNQCIEIAFMNGILINLSEKQMAEVARYSQKAVKTVSSKSSKKAKKGDVSAKKRVVLPPAPKGMKVAVPVESKPVGKTAIKKQKKTKRKVDKTKKVPKPVIPEKKTEMRKEEPQISSDTRKVIERSQLPPPEPVKPVEIKPVEIKPVEIKPVEIRPVEIKPVQTPIKEPERVPVKKAVKKSAVDRIAELKKKRPTDQDEL